MKLEVEQLAMPKKKAEEEFDALKKIFKQHNTFRTQDQIYKDMQKVYGHLQHGKKIIDIFEAFRKVGLNEDSDPKLAIVRADAAICYLHKRENGSAKFSMNEFDRYWRETKSSGDTILPPQTFTWPRIPNPTSYDPERTGIKNSRAKTIVPIIPPHILVTEVKALMPNYHILWEVEKWQPIPPKDPILLKKLTPNLFGVLATWNLTELERAIIRGRIL